MHDTSQHVLHIKKQWQRPAAIVECETQLGSAQWETVRVNCACGKVATQNRSHAFKSLVIPTWLCFATRLQEASWPRMSMFRPWLNLKRDLRWTFGWFSGRNPILLLLPPPQTGPIKSQKKSSVTPVWGWINLVMFTCRTQIKCK